MGRKGCESNLTWFEDPSVYEWCRVSSHSF